MCIKMTIPDQFIGRPEWQIWLGHVQIGIKDGAIHTWYGQIAAHKGLTGLFLGPKRSAGTQLVFTYRGSEYCRTIRDCMLIQPHKGEYDITMGKEYVWYDLPAVVDLEDIRYASINDQGGIVAVTCCTVLRPDILGDWFHEVEHLIDGYRTIYETLIKAIQ